MHRCNCRWGSERPPARAWVGAYGELVAASWLRAQGCRVLRRNFRWGSSGEVDIICRDGDTLVFVEVKSGTVDGPHPLSSKVDQEKRKLLRRGARSWLVRLKDPVPYRFDIIEVHLRNGRKPRVVQLRDAFSMIPPDRSS